MPTHTKLAIVGGSLLVLYIVCFGWRDGLRIWLGAVALGAIGIVLAAK